MAKDHRNRVQSRKIATKPFTGTVIMAATALLLAAGCETRVPDQALSWAPPTAAQLQLSERWFETGDERRVVKAAETVLRSAGYGMLGASDRDLGLLIAAKETDIAAWEVARDVGKITAVLVLTLGKGGDLIAIQKSQELGVSVVTRSDRQRKTHVRVTFQRLVWNSDREGQSQILDEPDIHRLFFSKLADALSLEAQRP